MTTDIVERLRRRWDEDCKLAADEIERLRAEVEEWKDRYEAERNDHEATMRREP